jgi:hypothetical protein
VPDLLLHVFGYGQVKRFPRNGLPWTLTAAIVVGELAAATRRGSLLAAAAALAVASLGYQAGVPEGTPLTLAIAALTIAAVVTGVAIGIRRLAPGRTDTPVAPVAAVLLLALAVAAGSIRADASRVVSDLRHGPALQTAALPRIPAPVIAFFRHHDQTRPVVLAESYIGYQLAGEADVYPVALPLERSRGEARNDPVARRRAVNMALAPGAPNTLRRRILTRYHAGYVLINQTTTPHAAAGLDADPDLRRVLTYRTWIAYRVDTFRTTT